MLDENGDPINLDKSMMCDSIGTAAGAILGTSTCTTFVESASGIAAGGRTGLASLVTAACFAVCLFLSPIAGVIPTCATAPALIFVGVLMAKNFAKIDMDDMRSAVPAFLTFLMIPLTYSISNGIGVGSISYVLITLFLMKWILILSCKRYISFSVRFARSLASSRPDSSFGLRHGLDAGS